MARGVSKCDAFADSAIRIGGRFVGEERFFLFCRQLEWLRKHWHMIHNLLLGWMGGRAHAWSYRTANTAGQDGMQLSGIVSTANITVVANGDWALIAPYGKHPAPEGSYTQVFQRREADRMVAAWNSIPGHAARTFKNLWHGLGTANSVPIWDGHPETDKTRWASEKLLGAVTEIRAGVNGLEGRITWNAKGLASRTRGPLFPSPLWWHMPPAGSPPEVYPELLESVGLVPSANIAGVPAWTLNAARFQPGQTDLTPAQRAALRARDIAHLTSGGLSYEDAFNQATNEPGISATANTRGYPDTAEGRASMIQTEVQRVMRLGKSYDQAFGIVQNLPEFKAIFAAMENAPRT